MAYLSPIIPSLDLTYTYSAMPIVGNRDTFPANPGTLWDFLSSNKDRFGLFRHLVWKSGQAQFFNNTISNFTVFIPVDNLLREHMTEGQILNASEAEAWAIVNYSTLTRKIPLDVLKSSECLRVDTRQDYTRLNTSYDPETDVLLLDKKARVVQGDLILNNGIVHLTDNLIMPQQL